MIDDCRVSVYTSVDYDPDAVKRCIAESGVLNNVRPNDSVLIKPNLVQEKHDYNDDWDYMITHPVVITAVIELVLERLTSEGSITVADAPMTPTNWSKLIEHLPVSCWAELCEKKNVSFRLLDLRDEEWHNAPNGIILEKVALPGDPLGKVLYNLEDDASEFYGKVNSKEGLYGACYDIKETNDAHNGHNNMYSLSGSVAASDIVINLPKLKTHKKGGVTCCLKNLIGINTNKNLLPHHTTGTPSEGGDQFADSDGLKKLESGATVYAKKVVNRVKFLTPLLVPLKNLAIRVWGDNRESIRSGSWYGNDTLWRTILDLNKAFFYGDTDGNILSDKPENMHRYIAIVDGIYAGEGDGPLAPDKKEAGLLLCGTNPVAIDSVAVELMGFDYKKIPSISRAFDIKRYRLASFSHEDIKCRINGDSVVSVADIHNQTPVFHFKPALGWTGHIEAKEAANV